MPVLVMLWALLSACASQAVQPPTMAGVLAASDAEDWRTPDSEDVLYLELDSGRIVMELAPQFAPGHVANIRALVREGYFDGLFVIRSQDNYVVQWGDPHADDPERARPVRHAQRALPAEFARPAEGLSFTPLGSMDSYAPEAGFSGGFHAARDDDAGRAWLAHCYGTLGVSRGNTADSGSGAGLYVVIGHAPRHLDRNITVVGRVLKGMERLSVLPRGTGALGFYESDSEYVPIRAMRVAADVPAAERTPVEVLRTDTPTFARLIEARRHRHEPWFLDQVGRIELCNVPIPVR
jgi:peptidylprolyl isomerase